MPNEEFCPNHATGGIVYLIDTLHVSKIGVTRMRMQERFQQYKSHNPHNPMITRTWDCIDPYEVEDRLKSRLAPYKTPNGAEWFILPKRVHAWLCAQEDIEESALAWDMARWRLGDVMPDPNYTGIFARK